MADISNNLRLKYGLRSQPTSIAVSQWVQLTEAFIRERFSPEDAGRRAARQLFPDFGTHVYASQSDDIEMLLDAAKNR